MKQAAGILIATLVILIIVVYNGYPLVTADSGSYIKYAFDFQFPADRSPFYGVFLGFSGMRFSLWLSIIAQAALVSALLWQFANLDMGGKPVNAFLFTLLVIICTPVAWVASFLMPDIFTSVLLLACILFLFETNKRKLWLYAALVFLATIVHNSHFLIMLLFSGGMAMLSIFRNQRKLLRKSAWLFLISVSCWMFTSSLYFFKGFGFTISPGKHVFMMGKLAETGILKKYLDAHCAHRQLPLCEYKDEIPASAIEFLWGGNSPLYKTGGWDSSKAAYDRIIFDVFTTPVYVSSFAQQSFLYSCRQLTMISLPPDFTPMGVGSPPWLFINRHLPKELKAYETSKQNTGTLNTGFANNAYIFFLLVTGFWAIFILMRPGEKQLICYLYFSVLAFIICNAFVTATFANVLDRLQYRVFWMLPATNIWIIARHYRAR